MLLLLFMLAFFKMYNFLRCNGVLVFSSSELFEHSTAFVAQKLPVFDEACRTVYHCAVRFALFSFSLNGFVFTCRSLSWENTYTEYDTVLLMVPTEEGGKIFNSTVMWKLRRCLQGLAASPLPLPAASQCTEAFPFIMHHLSMIAQPASFTLCIVSQVVV